MTDRQFTDLDLAALYDALSPRADRQDFDFYRPLALAAASVLDLGCGTGTFLRELRRAGHAGRLCGLDPASGMLAQAREDPTIEWRQGELPAAGFEGAFEMVVMAGHAFQVLIDDAAIRAVLDAARRALTPEGYLAFETRNPAVRGWERWPADYTTTVQDPDGQPVAVVCRIERPFDGRHVSFSLSFAAAAWPAPRVSRTTLRFLSAVEIDAALAEAGFAVVERYGDWDRSPVTDASPEIITVARRT